MRGLGWEGGAVTDEEKWWYNHTTGEVEYGRKSLGLHRDGPFETEADARRAPQIAQERAELWAAEEAED